MPTPAEVEGRRRARHYDEYTLRLDAGRRYILRVNARAFDPVARLYRDGETTTVAENDDDGDGPELAHLLRARDSGDYVLRVAADRQRRHAAPTRPAPSVAPPLPAPLTAFPRRPMVWKVYEGALTNATARSRAARRSTIIWSASRPARSGFISLDAADFDAVVQVLAVDGRDTRRAARLQRRWRQFAELAASLQGGDGRRLYRPGHLARRRRPRQPTGCGSASSKPTIRRRRDRLRAGPVVAAGPERGEEAGDGAVAVHPRGYIRR